MVSSAGSAEVCQGVLSLGLRALDHSSAGACPQASQSDGGFFMYLAVVEVGAQLSLLLDPLSPEVSLRWESTKGCIS
eukprot:4167989-Amphidinium_carterae.1